MVTHRTGGAAMDDDMGEAPDPQAEPPNLRFLRRLVTVLTATMIVGLCTIIALFVIRFSGSGAQTSLALPDTIVLPDGSAPVAFTQARDWYAVVTDGDEILIFDRDDGTLRQRIAVTR